MVGGCLCGGVRYSVDAEPELVALCHCEDCQKQTGSAFSILVAVPEESVRIEGRLTAYEGVGASGWPVTRRFCPGCGSPILSDVSITPDLLWIRGGTLDDRSWLRPQMNIWCDSAQPWVFMDRAIPGSPRTRRSASRPSPRPARGGGWGRC
ncbi:aldehyde-activating protein [Rubrobacter marinus]|uniref:Aldehyde-activating protein n=1 Tax=Rubrobacter marinus TaxID=2653852 RepID=A0A6G8Q0U6_9ACTN|nr:aldehyde-activating protein [Rubrobacter marinus]